MIINPTAAECQSISVKGGEKLDQPGGVKLGQENDGEMGVLKEGMASGAEACAA